MSELLYDNSELFEDDQGHDSGVAGLAVDGLLYGFPLVERDNQTIFVEGEIEGHFNTKALIKILGFRLISLAPIF